jgi:hypothetical protein
MEASLNVSIFIEATAIARTPAFLQAKTVLTILFLRHIKRFLLRTLSLVGTSLALPLLRTIFCLSSFL